MWNVVRAYLIRFIVGIVFTAVGGILASIGISESELESIIGALLSGGVGIGVIISMLVNAAKSDPENFRSRVTPKR